MRPCTESNLVPKFIRLASFSFPIQLLIHRYIDYELQWVLLTVYSHLLVRDYVQLATQHFRLFNLSVVVPLLKSPSKDQVGQRLAPLHARPGDSVPTFLLFELIRPL